MLHHLPGGGQDGNGTLAFGGGFAISGIVWIREQDYIRIGLKLNPDR